MQDEDKAFGELLRQKATRHVAPPDLRAHIKAMAQTQARKPAAASSRWFGRFTDWGWLNLGGAMAVGALCALLLLPVLHQPPAAQEAPLLAQLVDDHIRSLQAGHLTDLPSTEQQAVKPWFAGKLDFTPPVHDLAAAGVALAGGRLDVAGGRAVAAVVYRDGPHVINVFVMPAEGHVTQPAGRPAQRGYNVVRWSNGSLACWAVSDATPDELMRFARAFWGKQAVG